MVALNADIALFMPFEGANTEVLRNVYDLWLRTSPDGPWVFGCACHSAVAAFVCMKYVRTTWPLITVKVKPQQGGTHSG